MVKKDVEKYIRENCTLCSGAHLYADGYKLTLTEVRVKNKIEVAVYINGMVRGKWFLCNTHSYFVAKYYHIKSHYVHDLKFRNSIKKILGTKKYIAEKAKWEAKMSFPELHFPSVATAIRHYKKTCNDVEIFDEKKHIKLKELP